MVIMSFENEKICEEIYSLLLFYIDTYSMAEPEKLKCKYLLIEFLSKFLGWKIPLKASLSEKFDEEKFYAKLAGSEEVIDMKGWVIEEKEEALMVIGEQDEEKESEKKKMSLLADKDSKYSYLPVKSDKKDILYGS